MSNSSTLALPDVIPPIAFTKGIGPVRLRLRNRARTAYAGLLLLGALPTVLPLLGLTNANAASQAVGWGMWLPGAGFIAVGGWTVLLFPLTLVLFIVARLAWALAGMAAFPFAVWLLAALAAGGMAKVETAAYAPFTVSALTLAYWMLQGSKASRDLRAQTKLAQIRSGYLDDAVAELEQVACLAPPPAERELSIDDLAAARFLFDAALQPIGSFEGFTLKDNFQLAALRYQLSHLNYALALIQCKYTPSFHGYLNTAQQFGIESLTDPRVCGYWKWESLGGRLRWNPDPVGTWDNVMLTGWSLIPLATYAANTGDLRYQEPGALKFRPFKRWSKSYAHDTHSFVKSLTSNYERSPYYLYPCEPTLTFTICNAFGYSGLVAYERLNPTGNLPAVQRRFLDSFESEFVRADGTPHVILNTLTGSSEAGLPGPAFALGSLLAMSRLANPLHRGYAKRWYAMARHEFLRLNGDDLVLEGLDWSDGFDIGNYRKLPGGLIADIALAAREQGDDAVAEAALRKADELLQRVETPGVLAYQGVSMATNLNLAAARWSRRDDWHDLIHLGPDPRALAGPILADCAYPAVLVARAVSDGVGLELVLHNGLGHGRQRLRIERLTSGAVYVAHGAIEGSIVADVHGVGMLHVELNGRTVVSLEKRDAVQSTAGAKG